MTAINELVEKVEDGIARYGWYVIGVVGDTPGETFFYTVGLTAAEHPELVVSGLPQQTAHNILTELAIRVVRHGADISGELADVIRGLPVRIVDVSAADVPTNVAFRIYGEERVSACQVVWPDPDGRFPWEPEFGLSWRGRQPLVEKGLGDEASHREA